MRLGEGILFISLAGAAHIGFWAGVADIGGATSAGARGTDAMTVAAALPSHQALVARWETAPQAAVTPAALTPPTPQAPGPMLPAAKTAPPPATAVNPPKPMAALRQPAAPDSAPQALPDPEPQAPQIRPQARPAAPDSAPRAAQVATGSGAQAQKGHAGKTAVASASAHQTRALMAQWGGSINARIQRYVIYPTGSTAKGTAKLALTIGRDGALNGVAIQSSTGDAALDQAALRAAKRAGRFPSAPDGLTDAQYRFAISLTFSRN